ncbi:MAG TPA: CHAP domain-containing protein [Nitrospiraceae bacterium]|nr:CHAP domain-containing protein [Nitrospiraceae bacterium]
MKSTNAGLLLSFSAMAAIGLIVGCSALDYGATERNHTASLNCCTLQPGTARQQALARAATKLVGSRTVQIGNRIVSYDCAGVTRAIYLSEGHDLYEGSNGTGRANGVRLIYEHVRKHGEIHRGPAVRPGDLVFFDNTWDFNEDGMLNDPLTHVGIVEEVEQDGTVVFISRVSNAIERYRMNLRAPDTARGTDGRIFNDYLRRKKAGDPHGTVYLTGQLFVGFGSVDE